ncbi:hypothetical protein SUGI_0810240 [Cryptomeria japonica]|nr:hypothetical protein SUGI_0810240 [Cryptomeria japonica]
MASKPVSLIAVCLFAVSILCECVRATYTTNNQYNTALHMTQVRAGSGAGNTIGLHIVTKQALSWELPSA